MRLQWKYLHNRDSKTIFSLVTITTYPWDFHPRETGAQPVWDTTCNVLRCFPRGRSSINSPTGSSLRDTRGVLVRHINWSSFKVKRNFSENATPWNIYIREILYSQKHNYDLTGYGDIELSIGGIFIILFICIHIHYIRLMIFSRACNKYYE